MPESRHYWLILVLFSGLSSGTATTSKYLCQGDSVQLFENITFVNGSVVNLYINGLRKTLIGTWHSVQNHFILEGYKEKVFVDEYRNIWIRNIQLSDNGTYLLQYNTDIMKLEVQIYVMVAPTYFCKPKIEKTESFLIATLGTEDCGRPLAHVQWLEYPEISYIRKDMVKLPHENESGTYYACAESPALRCVNNLRISSYCRGFTVKGKVINPAIETKTGEDKDNSPPLSFGISHSMAVTYVIVLIVSISMLILAITAIIIIKRRKSKNKSSRSISTASINQACDCLDLRNETLREGNISVPRTTNLTEVTNLPSETKLVKDKGEMESFLMETKDRASIYNAQNACRFGKRSSHRFYSDPFPS